MNLPMFLHCKSLMEKQKRAMPFPSLENSRQISLPVRNSPKWWFNKVIPSKCPKKFRLRNYTLPETNSSHLKMDGWNTIISFWGPAQFSVVVLGTIVWVVPPSQVASDHQDYFMFSIGDSQPKPSFATGILGKGDNPNLN